MRNYFIFILAILSFNAFATHNRAGEITYEQIGPLTIRMTVTTYTKESSTAADRDSLEISWGDGITEWVKRVNGKGQSLDNDVKMNKYTAEHTYPGRSSYTVYFIDPNRSGNIVNINYPRSDDVKFFLSTRLTLLDIQFQGSNSSAQLLQPPIDVACIGQPFIHNPNAYDPDGDSLSYELVVPFQAENTPVPNYFFPDQLVPGPNNIITLNPKTGDFIWKFPPQYGEYNIAMKINEWRGGVLINSIIRDMQILVTDCKSKPPVIDVDEQICVIAGTEINLPIKISDPDLNQKVKITVTGGPFTFDKDKAQIVGPSLFTKTPFNANLIWKTNCNHIAKEFYQIVIRAVDNSIGDTSGLATLKTIKIKVVGPPPLLPIAKALDDTSIRVEWQKPYICEKADKDYFYGFSVWRKTTSLDLPIDTCNVASLRGNYTRIVFNTKQNDVEGYYIIDKDVKPNTTYCYRIVAEFAFKTASGNPYKRVESIFSEEQCIQLKRDIPLITKVSVANTSQNNGSIDLRWTKPTIIDFDTLKFKGPYTTELYRSEINKNQFQLISASIKKNNFFKSWSDTIYSDISLNTQSIQYEYRLKFYYENNIEYKPIPEASSVYLQIAPSDKKNILSIDYKTPWSNKFFNIYRKDDNSGFKLIGSTRTSTYTDDNLSNDLNYCYYVEALGTYSIPKIENPLINFSQEICSKPIDNVPPCIPILSVKSICDEELLTNTKAENTLKWITPPDCNDNESPKFYNIYFRENITGKHTLINKNVGTDQSFIHQPDTNSIAGCYVITSLDNKGNESEFSNEICIENCPVYELPNTFTPNEDGNNEVFKPIKNYFIQEVNFQLYNEWGNKIFNTSNPAINWDGTHSNGNKVADGTYYYTCTLVTKTVDGIQNNSSLKGYINVIR